MKALGLLGYHILAVARRYTRHLLISLLVVMGTVLPVQAAQSVEVIANRKADVDSISTASLRAIFAMRIRQWPNGDPVTVFVLPDQDSTHGAFCKEMLRIYPYMLRDTWDRMVYTGAGQAPIKANNPEELLKSVSTTPGSIGYIEKGKANDSVKTLQIR